MTDPSGTPYTPPPSAYPSAPPPAAGPVSGGPVPGKTLGIVSIVVAFFASPIAIILSIIALVQSRKAGAKNVPAIWGLILGIIFTIISAIVIAGIVFAAIGLAAQCADLGPGMHEVNGVTYTCS